MKKIALLLFFVFVGLESFAQDIIIYKDKTIDEVTIVEVTPDYVKYREFGDPINSTTTSVEKDYLQKVILKSGRTIDFSLEMINDPKIYSGQRNRALKIDVLGINENSLHVSYEQAISPSKSWEGGIVFIGAGFETQGFDLHLENAMGIGLISGIKFKRAPNFYLAKMRYGHILRGTYFRPNLNMNSFRYSLQDKSHPPDPATMLYPTIQSNALAAAINMDFGNQIVLDDRYLVDYSFGIGYGFTTKQYIPEASWETPPYPPANNYTFYGGRRQINGRDYSGNPIEYLTSPLTYVVNLKVGYLLPNK